MFTYCNNCPTGYIDISGNVPVKILDTDGDGEDDCYVYEYTYTEGWLFPEKKTGYVYIYINISSEAEFDSLEKPEGFNQNTDLLVADWTNNENATLMAYQAHRIKKACRDEIVDCLFMYTSDYEKTWERTKESVLVEWREHHRYRIGGKRAQNISFDEKEEGEGFFYFFGKAVGIN